MISTHVYFFLLFWIVSLTTSQTINPQSLQNVANISRASVYASASDMCGDGQSVVYPGNDLTEYHCRSGCPRTVDTTYSSQTLSIDSLLVGGCEAAGVRCEAEVEVTVISNQTFAFWVKPMPSGDDLTHRYILRMSALSIKVTRNVLSVQYLSVTQGTFELMDDQWNYFALAVEYFDTAVRFYAYVNGQFVGSAGETISEELNLLGSDTITAQIGDCGVAECSDEEMGETMVKEFYVYSGIISSRQISGMFSGTIPETLPSNHCVCPAERPVLYNDMTCMSSLRIPIYRSRFYTNSAYYFPPDLMLYPVDIPDAFLNGDMDYPIFYATRPGAAESSFTIDIMLSQVESVVINSRTKYPEEAIYVSGFNSFTDNEYEVRRALVPSGGCAAVTDDTYTCIELNDTESVNDIYSYSLNLSDLYPELTSVLIRYVGLPVWEGHNVENSKRAHLITSVQIFGRMVPYVIDVEPSYGPMAGGTMLTISGLSLNLSVATVMVGSQNCSVTSTDESAVMCRLAPMDDSTTSVGDILNISLEFAAGEILSAIGEFAYRDNPEVSRLERLDTFASSGLSVTVSGQNLDSAWMPYMMYTANYNGQTYTQENELCSVLSDTELSCPYPTLNTGSVVVTDWSDVTYSLGMAFDGFMDYENLSILLADYAVARVYQDPSVMTFENIPRKLRQWQDTSLMIMGEQLFSGCTAEDYRVVIGESECEITEINEDGITCTPPDESPNYSLEYDIWHENPQVVVLVGRRNMHVGWLVYEPTVWDDVSIRVAILSVVFAVAMVILVIALICIERARKRKSHEQFEAELMSSFTSEDAKRIKSLTIDPTLIEVQKTLIRGELGKLAVGTYRHPDYNQKVLIKKMILAQFASKQFHIRQINTFLNRAVSLAGLEDATIQRVIGVARIPEGAYAVYAHAQWPDLKTYLRSSHLALNFGDLTRMCSELSAAMYYLSSMEMIHGDLAARCCVVDSQGNAMLCDNAMARAINPDEYAQVRGFSKTVPVRWMAPEYLQGVPPTIHSDVWSFGILCWEILTRGRWPYENLLLDQVISLVFKGGHAEQPKSSPTEMFDLMKECWRQDAQSRPGFRYIDQYLDQCLSQANMSRRRRPTATGDPMCDVNIRDSSVYQRQVTPPPANYDEKFGQMAGKYNLGFVSISDEYTRV